MVDRCVDSGNEVSASSQLGKLRKLRIHYRLHGYRERSQCKYEASLRLRKRVSIPHTLTVWRFKKDGRWVDWVRGWELKPAPVKAALVRGGGWAFKNKVPRSLYIKKAKEGVEKKDVNCIVLTGQGTHSWITAWWCLRSLD